MIVEEIRRCNDTNLCWLALNALTQYQPERFSTEIVGILRSIYHEQAGRAKTNLQIRQLCGQLLLRTDITLGDLINLMVGKTEENAAVNQWVCSFLALGSGQNESSTRCLHVAIDFEYGGERRNDLVSIEYEFLVRFVHTARFGFPLVARSSSFSNMVSSIWPTRVWHSKDNRITIADHCWKHLALGFITPFHSWWVNWEPCVKAILICIFNNMESEIDWICYP